MGFWKNALYHTSILMLIAVILTLVVTQSIMSVLFHVQAKEVADVMPVILTKIIVFSIEFLYISSVMLFLANLTKIAKIVAIIAITLHLSYRFLNMYIEYSATNSPIHIVNMSIVVMGLISLLIYAKLSKQKNS